MQVRTQQNDTLDAVLWRYMGDGDYLAVTLQRNPQIAGLGAVLPGGMCIDLPDPVTEPEPTQNTISLWD